MNTNNGTNQPPVALSFGQRLAAAIADGLAKAISNGTVEASDRAAEMIAALKGAK